MKILLSLILSFLPFSLFAQTVGRVISITDGDTFVIMASDSTKKTVRLYGIDCPESGQPYSNVSKIFLRELIFDKDILIEEKGRDRHKRTLAIVFKDSINVNETLLTNGMAWHYKKYDNNVNWSNLEIEARLKKMGLWKEENSVPPWNWREDRAKRARKTSKVDKQKIE